MGLACLALAWQPAQAQNVLTYHNSPDRSGVYSVPGLSLSAAAELHPDPGFHASFSGNVFAQPLYWHAPGTKAGILIVATSSNSVYALNADTGAQVWKTQLARPAPRSVFECGNIDPEGITGTPVIDEDRGALYLDATVLTQANTPRHFIYALAIATGKVLPGWPLNVEAAMNARRTGFSSHVQGQRSALLLAGGKLYVEYGGRAGDCGGYRGTVIEFAPANRSITGSWATRALGGGIWSQGGLASDGRVLYATTGNTFGAERWGDGEAVIRLRAGLARSTSTADYFAPANWKTLDAYDLDLGGTQALPINLPTPAGPVARVVAMGKDGKAYLLNAANLGGIGRPLAVEPLSSTPIITAPAIYNAKAATLIAFTNYGGLRPDCAGNTMMMLRIARGAEPIQVGWCAPFSGGGAPIITETAGGTNPIVWVVGAEGDNKLHGFAAFTGKRVYESVTSMTGLRHFQTLIAANHHLYVAGDNKVYAFTF
jgi:outer membrane protein assembly factor BamB